MQNKSISVREFSSKEIVKEISGREDVEVLVDPTMLITKEEWSKLSIKPSWIEGNEKYILKAFLGDSKIVDKQLEEFAKNHNYKIIDIYNENSPYYDIGPAEFLYLEENAKLVFTDSYHGAIFATLFQRPLLIYKRKDVNEKEMYSRIKTLIKKFNLKNVEYNGEITDKYLYSNTEEIEKHLEIERGLAKNYLERYLKND